MDLRYNAALGRYEGQSLKLTSHLRSESGVCGPEGLLFDSKDTLGQVRKALTSNRAQAGYATAILLGAILGSPWLF
jgi:hypothetical protein